MGKTEFLYGEINGGFWGKLQEKIARETLYQQYEILNGKKEELRPEQYSHCIENFEIAAGKKKAKYKGYVYSDSELGKWMEACAYSLRNEPDEKLEKIMDDLVDLISDAQMDDGYLNTYFQILRPESRLKHFAFSCELYNMGHLMEAAVAYYEVTGKRKFLDRMCRVGDFLCALMEKEDYCHVYDGHPEIELGLCSLFRVTGERKYLLLAKHFIDERGKQPCFFQTEDLLGDNDDGANNKWFGADHHLAHMLVREQNKADGHAVKAVYLYSAVADIVREGLDHDGTLEKSMLKVWKNMTEKRMYVTGGIGSQSYAERFTTDYDLPSDRGYMETCASIGICLWGKRLLELYSDTSYADIMERALYNNILAGWSLDGKGYFYTNTLHYKRNITDYREDCKHLEKKRQGWFQCACCPPNIMRFITNIQNYALVAKQNMIFFNLYMQGQWKVKIYEDIIMVTVQTDYPYDGVIRMRFLANRKPITINIALRIPDWCTKYGLCINDKVEMNTEKSENGYVMLDMDLSREKTVILNLFMNAEYVFPNKNIWDCIGKVALMRGPIIYCLESVDYEDDNLDGIGIFLNSSISVIEGEGILEGVKLLETEGYKYRSNSYDRLYAYEPAKVDKCRIVAVPYYAWQNRGETDMDVWFPYRE